MQEQYDYNYRGRNDNDYGWVSIQDKKQEHCWRVSDSSLQAEELLWIPISVTATTTAHSIGENDYTLRGSFIIR